MNCGSARALRAVRVRPGEYPYPFLLRDFYLLFAGYGYVVGKIYPDYVEFRDYDLGDEDFIGPNYLACRAGDPMVSVLRQRGGSR